MPTQGVGHSPPSPSRLGNFGEQVRGNRASLDTSPPEPCRTLPNARVGSAARWAGSPRRSRYGCRCKRGSPPALLLDVVVAVVHGAIDCRQTQVRLGFRAVESGGIAPRLVQLRLAQLAQPRDERLALRVSG